MSKISMFPMTSTSAQRMAIGRGLLYSGLFASALMLAGCAGEFGVEVENTQAAQEVARLSRPPGSVYTGWRVFQDRCASCHGPDATGTEMGLDLLPVVREMGPRRFIGLVLKRYDWNLSPAGSDSEALDDLIEEIMQRNGPVLTMPAWEGEPSVNAHILDLYAYLSARADGTQGKGRPLP
jgi:mono/diheme cytochrome c family protein